MTEDPILMTGLAIALILMPVLSNWLGNIKPKLVFVLPVLSLLISFPMFLFLVIVGNTPISRYLFYISMILWTSGFFTVFISYIMYRVKRNKDN